MLSLLYSFFLLIVLSSYWFVLSGHSTLYFLINGAVSVCFTLLVIKRLHMLHCRHCFAFLHPRAWYYPFWLAKEMLVSAIDVTIRIWQASLPISPVLFTVDTRIKTDGGNTLLAHSITLTPGTICVDVAPSKVLVHSLTKEGAKAVEEGIMEAKIFAMEGKVS